MTIHLPEPIERSVNEAVESGRFPTVDDALAAAWIAFETPNQGQSAPSPEPPARAFKPIWEEIEELTADIPDEEFLKLPADGAAQHDHYIYGLPKRPAS